MAPHNIDIDEVVSGGTAFRSDILADYDKTEWPDRIDYVADQLTKGEYAIGLDSGDPTYLTDGYDLDNAAREFYLRGIAALTGDISRTTALPDNFQLGTLLVEFAGLREGLEDVDRRDVPPGEILSRTIMRTVQRQSDTEQAQLAQQLRADTETPRELVAELTTVPEVAPLVESAIPDPEDTATLTTELASLDLTTKLWDHQLESLALWLHHDMNAYVDMATATGKTVLGLAAVAHAVDSGSLHPSDQERLEDIFDGTLPDPHRDRPNDVLIVTTDDLLGVQWARLFQDHCHTPPSFTQVQDSGIQLPWGRIDIRSAGGLADVDPSDYRLAIFDEVHNYSGRSGWGSHLVEFVESSCPVLALTGSVTDQLESLVEQSNRPFLPVYRYTHKLALADGVIPDFEWTLQFTDVAGSDTLDQFRETAGLFEEVVAYDSGSYRVTSDNLAPVAPTADKSEREAMAGEYVSGSSLASGLREAGGGDVAPTEELESLAGGISNRTIHRLNLRADLEPIVEATEAALSAGRPTLVLTRSYGEANDLWKALYDRHDNDRLVRALDADQDASEQDATIQAFDESEAEEKVLIGPGKRIGQGNDIKSVEVGINISRPGSGVNTTLVQRLGRLLRDAGGKDRVDFYHVIGVPPADAAIDPDGEAFVETAADFFGQVLEPDTDGILKPPSVDISDGQGTDVAALEGRGAPHVLSNDQSTAIESAYATAIAERPASDDPTIMTDWFSDAFEDEIEVPVIKGSDNGRTRTTADDEVGRNGDSEKPVANTYEGGQKQRSVAENNGTDSQAEGTETNDERVDRAKTSDDANAETGVSEIVAAIDCLDQSDAEQLSEAGYESLGDLLGAPRLELDSVVGKSLAARMKKEIDGSEATTGEQGQSEDGSSETTDQSEKTARRTDTTTTTDVDRAGDDETANPEAGSEDGDSGTKRNSTSMTTAAEEKQADRTDVDVADCVSPLAEYYDAFRSLGIIQKGLQESADSGLPDAGPGSRWIKDVRSILTEEGFGDQSVGYGIQQNSRSPFSISEYRRTHGTEERITDFEAVSVCEPSAAIEALLDDSLTTLSSWILPVTPDSEVPLPIVVESEAELERARGLLSEFPTEPPVYAENRGNESSGRADTTEPGDSDTSEPERPDIGGTEKGTSESAGDREARPIQLEDVNSIQGSVADALRDAGYQTRTDLQRASDDELAAVEGVSAQRAQMIRAVVGSREDDQSWPESREETEGGSVESVVSNENTEREDSQSLEVHVRTQNGSPVSGAAITLENGTFEIVGESGSQGRCVLRVTDSSGEARLSVDHGDFESASGVVSIDSGQVYDIQLTPKKTEPDDSPDSTAETGNKSTDGPSRDELIDELHRLNDEWSGDIDRRLMLTVGNYHPDDYEAEFGSLETVLAEIDLDSADADEEARRQELLDELQNLDERYSTINRVLLYSVSDFHPDDYDEEFGSLENALAEAGIDESAG